MKCKHTVKKIVSPLDKLNESEPSVGVQPNVILKDGHIIVYGVSTMHRPLLVNLFFLLCSRMDNPKLAKQYKEQIDSLIEEFSPFTFQERQ